MKPRGCHLGVVLALSLLLLAPRQARGQAQTQQAGSPALQFEPPVLFAPSAPGLPAAELARERALSAHLTALAAGSWARPWAGALSLGLGALAVGLGLTLPESGVDPLLLTVGAGSMARGTITLTLSPRPEPVKERYLALPMHTAAALRARVAYGEAGLMRLARAGRRARVGDALLSLALASSYVPISWGSARRENPRYRFGDAAIDFVALTVSALQFASAFVSLFRESESEAHARSYFSQRGEVATRSTPDARPDARVDAHGARPPCACAAQRHAGVAASFRF